MRIKFRVSPQKSETEIQQTYLAVESSVQEPHKGYHNQEERWWPKFGRYGKFTTGFCLKEGSSTGGFKFGGHRRKLLKCQIWFHTSISGYKSLTCYQHIFMVNR